jgi:hypothetical protein
MSTTLVCPTCKTRWKIVAAGEGDKPALCPVCTPPPGHLIAQTFDDICPERP